MIHAYRILNGIFFNTVTQNYKQYIFRYERLPYVSDDIQNQSKRLSNTSDFC